MAWTTLTMILKLLVSSSMMPGKSTKISRALILHSSLKKLDKKMVHLPNSWKCLRGLWSMRRTLDPVVSQTVNQPACKSQFSMKEMITKDAGTRPWKVTNAWTGFKLDTMSMQFWVSVTTTTAETQPIRAKLGATLTTHLTIKPGSTVLTQMSTHFYEIYLYHLTRLILEKL